MFCSNCGEETTVLSVPFIEGMIRGQGIIHGNFDEAMVDEMIRTLRMSCLPARVTVVRAWVDDGN